LLLIIEAFSRFVWVYPLKRKTGDEVARQLRVWLMECGQAPTTFQCDAGLEFFNQHVRRVLAAANIRLDLAVGTSKAALAERANKSIQMLMAKMMRANLRQHRGKLRYIDRLADLVRSYNNRPHRSLGGMTPREADKPENEEKVLQIHLARYRAVKRRQPAFKVNDIVRVKLESKILTPASRSYNPQFSEDFYYIYEVNHRLQIPMFYLKATKDDEQILGGFYAEELTKVGGDDFEVEKVLQRRRRGRQWEELVRWQGFSPRWDSWVPSRRVRDL